LSCLGFVNPKPRLGLTSNHTASRLVECAALFF
jgi:hypothetical protein